MRGRGASLPQADARANEDWPAALAHYTAALEQATGMRAAKETLIELYSRKGECHVQLGQLQPHHSLVRRQPPS